MDGLYAHMQFIILSSRKQTGRYWTKQNFKTETIFLKFWINTAMWHTKSCKISAITDQINALKFQGPSQNRCIQSIPWGSGWIMVATITTLATWSPCRSSSKVCGLYMLEEKCFDPEHVMKKRKALREMHLRIPIHSLSFLREDKRGNIARSRTAKQTECFESTTSFGTRNS